MHSGEWEYINMDKIFKGIFDTEQTSVIAPSTFLLCVGICLAIGAVLCVAYCFKNRYTKSFAVSLALLPATVCVVIMVVNGNIGAAVAVAGAFSLVRFRSAPGSAREIGAIFITMGAGLVAGMGYLAYAVLFALIMSVMLVVCNAVKIGRGRTEASLRSVRIVIPEDLDYTGVFDGVFGEYTSSCELVHIKTINMGSMFRLTYDVTLKDVSREKEMIDRIRERNGNLEVSLSRQENARGEL